MKNVWKGLTVGAFAGAAVGVMIDMAEETGRRAADVSARAAAEASSRAKSGAGHVAAVIGEKIDDWDVADKVDQVKEGVEQVIDKGKDALKH